MKLLDEHGKIASVSRTLNNWNKPYRKMLLGSLKVKWPHKQQHFSVAREVKAAVLEWLRWYGRSHTNSNLSYSDPANYEPHCAEKQTPGIA